MIAGASASASSIANGLVNRQLKTLKQNLEDAGFKHIEIVAYRNVLSITRNQMVDSLKDNLNSVMKEGKKYAVIAHSMGHYAAMASIAEGGLADRVAIFIGLAGAASGGNDPPLGCGKGVFGTAGDLNEAKCPALKELMIGTPNYGVDAFKEKFSSELSSMKKCSIAVQGDSFLKPADSGFFSDGVNHFVTFARHDNLPSHQKTVSLLIEICNIKP